MRRSPILSAVVWSTVSVAAGCGDDAPSFADAALANDAATVDGTPADASRAVADFPATVTTAIECGVAVPATVDVTITNSGPDPLVIASATASDGFAVATATPITIAAGASAALAVRPAPAVIGTDLAGSTRTGTLSFVTNESGDPTRTVALSAAIDGANLIIHDSSDPEGDPLGLLRMSSSACPQREQLFIHNIGNRPATLTAPTATGFAFGPFSPSAVVEADDYVVQPVTVSTNGLCGGTAVIRYEATGAVCSELPVALNATFSITGDSSNCFCS
jgi:hypothetical protein